MCDPLTRQVVEQIVREKCRAGGMFTAFDVTRAAARWGCPEPHGEMKHVVHRLFDAGAMGPEYRRRLITIAGADGPAWLYHHSSYDPGEYRLLDRTRLGTTWTAGRTRPARTRRSGGVEIAAVLGMLRRAGLAAEEGRWVLTFTPAERRRRRTWARSLARWVATGARFLSGPAD
jgi:hypothetical protein